MTRPVVAIVTGFTKCPELPALSLAPVIALKRAGVIDRILALTWDNPAIDGFVAPVAAMKDVELVRIPQPELNGPPLKTGIVYQIRNLEAALARVADPATLILKLRPDFVADAGFLEDKIVNFDWLCAPSDIPANFGAEMPPSPFAMKIWVPWADSNQPFFCEDGAFLGLKQDVEQLASREAEKHVDVLSAQPFGWFAHVLRFLMPFLPRYPIFNAYLRAFPHLPNDLAYRMVLVREMTDDAFFWHLLIAHAWILATSFHVDCGAPGQLALYTNTSNSQADWSSLRGLAVNSPYSNVEAWRDGQVPGGVMPGAARAYGRVVDDAWQTALFTRPELRDLTPDQIRGVLRNVNLYSRGFLEEAEREYFARLAGIYRRMWHKAA